MKSRAIKLSQKARQTRNQLLGIYIVCITVLTVTYSVVTALQHI